MICRNLKTETSEDDELVLTAQFNNEVSGWWWKLSIPLCFRPTIRLGDIPHVNSPTLHEIHTAVEVVFPELYGWGCSVVCVEEVERWHMGWWYIDRGSIWDLQQANRDLCNGHKADQDVPRGQLG